jgi:hypothetical protein
VLPLTRRDVDRFRILRTSLERFFRDLGTCWVVVPDREARSLAAEIGEPPYRVLPESRVIPELRFYNVLRALVGRSHRPTQGWSVQQLVKLAIADRVQTEFYLTLDADVICTRPVSCGQLIRGGRAVCRLRQRDVIDQWPEWYAWAERVLGLPASGVNRGVTPALLHTGSVLALHDWLAGRVSPPLQRLARGLPPGSLARTLLAGWRSYLLRTLPWTEYALYDTFVEATGRFDRHHSADERTTISGNSVWYRWMWPDWKPEESFTGRDDFYFSVVQSNQGFTVDEVWRRVAPYLRPREAEPA